MALHTWGACHSCRDPHYVPAYTHATHALLHYSVCSFYMYHICTQAGVFAASHETAGIHGTGIDQPPGTVGLGRGGM